MEDKIKKEPQQGEETRPEQAQPEQEAPGIQSEQKPAEQAQDAAGDKKQKKQDKKERSALEKELDEAKAAQDAAEKALAAAKDTLMRTAAEYDNFRKRSAREKEGSFNNGVSFAVTQLLPVADALEMAAAAPTEDENFKKGVEMTLTKFSEAFTKLGIEEIEAAGKPFDPELHSAVMQEPASEESPSGTVTKVLQKGYRIGTQIIRHAMVAMAE